MLKMTRLAAVAFLGAIAASAYADETAAAGKPTAAKAAVTVNGETIPQELIDMRLKAILAQGQQADTPELRQAVRDDLVNLELMAQEAGKKGLEKNPEVAMSLNLERQKVLAGAYVQDYIKTHPVSDTEVQQEYDKLKESLGGKEYHPRHILVESESEAKAIVAKLKKGGKFDALAKRSSKDTGSKENGGDLGWIPVGKISVAYVKPFGDALLKLSKGQVSEPVQSQFGWHVIQLEDVRDLKMPQVEELKPRIAQALQQQAVKKLLADLRAKAKITE